MTKTIRIIIERSDNAFSSYAENVPGIYGMGDTVDEAMESAMKSIRLLKRYNKRSVLPKELTNPYKVVFRFDVVSFLKYYRKIFTLAALERMTGINQKQFHHYASGLKKPRPAQSKKIENAIHSLGRELLRIEL